MAILCGGALYIYHSLPIDADLYQSARTNGIKGELHRYHQCLFGHRYNLCDHSIVLNH